MMTSFGAFGDESSFYTGKPKVDGFGYTFNFRNYRADQCKWQTADPLGYPDGFNNFAYVNNSTTKNIDYMGGYELDASAVDYINISSGIVYDNACDDNLSMASATVLDPSTRVWVKDITWQQSSKQSYATEWKKGLVPGQEWKMEYTYLYGVATNNGKSYYNNYTNYSEFVTEYNVHLDYTAYSIYRDEYGVIVNGNVRNFAHI